MRNSEHTFSACAKGFNSVAVNKFYNLIDSVCEKYKVFLCNIYKIDKTGIVTVSTILSNNLEFRGKKLVGSSSSAERGTLVTVEISMNVTENYMPSMFFFPRRKKISQWMKHS